MLVDKALKLLKNSPPYTYDLDTTQYADGSHQLETFAYDNSGNKSDPAVVKVSFNNGQLRPMITSMSVSPSSAPTSQTKSASAQLTSAVPAASASVRSEGAARAVDQSSEVMNTSSPIARPAAAPKTHAVKAMSVHSVTSEPVPFTSKSAPARVAMAPQVSAKSSAVAPPSSANPAAVAVNVKMANLRSGSASLDTGRITMKSIEPRVTRGEASVSSPHAVKTSIVLRSRAAGTESGAFISRAVSPSVSNTSKRTVVVARANGIKLSSTSGIRGRAVSSDVRNAAVSKPDVHLRSASPAGSAAKLALAPSVSKSSTFGEATCTAPRPVRVAGLPGIKNSDLSGVAHPTIACPPASLKKDTNAKLERAAVPGSSKTKLRDLFDELDGHILESR